MDVQTRINQLLALPPLPPFAEELLRAVTSENVDINHLVKLVARDQGITAKLIGTANSAYYPHSREIVNVEHAILRLGLRRVVNLLLGILFTKHFNPHRCPAFSVRRFWYDSMVVAFVTARLADAVGGKTGIDSGARLSGLLHNIGVLILAHAVPEEMLQVLRLKAAEPGRHLSTIESQVLGINHCQAGALLCDRWKLPASAVAAIGHYEDASYQADHSDVVALVRFAVAWNRLGFNALPVMEGYPVVVRLRQRTILDDVAGAARKEAEHIALLAQQLAC